MFRRILASAAINFAQAFVYNEKLGKDSETVLIYEVGNTLTDYISSKLGGSNLVNEGIYYRMLEDKGSYTTGNVYSYEELKNYDKNLTQTSDKLGLLTNNGVKIADFAYEIANVLTYKKNDGKFIVSSFNL